GEEKAMAEQLLEGVRRSRSDGGTVILESLLAPMAHFAVRVAHRRGLFRLLKGGRRLTAGEIGEALELQHRPVEAVLAAVTALGLLEVSDHRYGLSALAEDYLLESSPTYMGFLIDLSEGCPWSLAMLEQAVSSDRPQRADMNFANFEEQTAFARVFTRAMHSVSFGPALVWPELVDLSGVGLLLDVAGGSGAHSIG